MEFNKNSLIEEIKKEDEELEAEAFKLYCKNRLGKLLDDIKQSEDILEKCKLNLQGTTIEELQEKFNSPSYLIGNDTTVKEKYKRLATEARKV